MDVNVKDRFVTTAKTLLIHSADLHVTKFITMKIFNLSLPIFVLFIMVLTTAVTAEHCAVRRFEKVEKGIQNTFYIL
jgi:hypothetical protein